MFRCFFYNNKTNDEILLSNIHISYIFSNDKKIEYDLIHLNDNNSVYSAQDKEKNEISSSKSKRRLEKWEQIEIYVDLKAIQTDFNKTTNKKYSFLNLGIFIFTWIYSYSWFFTRVSTKITKRYC